MNECLDKDFKISSTYEKTVKRRHLELNRDIAHCRISLTAAKETYDNLEREISEKMVICGAGTAGMKALNVVIQIVISLLILKWYCDQKTLILSSDFKTLFTKQSPREILGLNFEKKTIYLNFNFPIYWSAIITPERIQ